jgi:two-component system, OmpR family, alkaline phosphatase synthesis response regulator PhoP
MDINTTQQTQPNPNRPGELDLGEDHGIVFVVEDDPDLQTILTFNLQKQGYKARCFAKAEEMLFFLEASPKLEPMGFVVDINLAGHMNGLELVRQLRGQKRTSKVPVLMLTAKGESTDIVKGLDEGADDYLPKPFDMDVFMARLKSCLRRGERATGGIAASKKAISIAGIDIDPVSHQVVVLGKEVQLTATEYGLLVSLMNRPNEVLSRDDLLLRLVGPNKTITGRTIDVHVRALRAKLARKAKHIVTVRGFGYKFVP